MEGRWGKKAVGIKENGIWVTSVINNIQTYKKQKTYNFSDIKLNRTSLNYNKRITISSETAS